MLGGASMEHIVPRWEWRTFGQDFGDAESRLAALAAENIQNSEEIYLVATGSGASVKIRDRLMDIKILEHVNADGLEQWRPVLKEAFPLAEPAVALVCSALEVPALPLPAGGFSQDRLLAELAPSGGPVHVVPVRKTRRRSHVLGCMAEVTDVIADGTKVRTVAIEDADPAKVLAAVRALKLDGYPNTSYPSGL